MASAGIASMKPNVAASIVEKMEVPGSGRSGSDEGRGRVHVSTGSSWCDYTSLSLYLYIYIYIDIDDDDDDDDDECVGIAWYMIYQTIM